MPVKKDQSGEHARKMLHHTKELLEQSEAALKKLRDALAKTNATLATVWRPARVRVVNGAQVSEVSREMKNRRPARECRVSHFFPCSHEECRPAAAGRRIPIGLREVETKNPALASMARGRQERDK